MKYENWLAGLKYLAGWKKRRLEEYCGSAREVYGLKPAQMEKINFLSSREKEALESHKKIWNLEAEYAYCIQHEIKLTTCGMDTYPRRLKNIYNPPYGLYYRGTLPPEEGCAVAVVGARSCSAYGKSTAGQIGQRLAREGISIISGLAEGIDGAAHRGAMEGGGKTYGVLGCGLDICYPGGNRQIYEALPDCGSVLSEYPRGTRPLPAHFPQRNRIISGLADCVIVVEAREKSGSLITADLALEQGREVYAVPGRVGDALSKGANRLIRQGAGIFLGISDFLEESRFFSAGSGFSIQKEKYILENLEKLVYSCVDLTPRNLEELMNQTGLSLAEAVPVITALLGKGCISEVYKNYFIRSDSDA